MSEFKELIKSFPKTREYVRDFFVYGFKTRDEFKEKSARTYDNERRRLESWLGEFVKQDYTDKGKNISLAIDSNLLDTNPLYRVWKTKSFTDNDILLHFYILDYLSYDEGFTIEALTDGILAFYNAVFDVQMVRRKCNDYVKEGLLRKEKVGKELLYFKEDSFFQTIEQSAAIADAIKYYHICAPLGIIGSTILDNQAFTNELFRVKHSFCVHTLESEILLATLIAMRDKCSISAKVLGSKSGKETTISGVPLQIFTSTKTGRRFLCLFDIDYQRFTCLRLDTIKAVTQLAPELEYDDLKEDLLYNHQYLWGVSFDNTERNPLETVKLTLHIDEETEGFILDRLKREGKGGTITKIATNTFVYEKSVYDSREMLPWIRTFTGRIIRLESNSKLQDLFYKDMNTMYDMYGI